MSTADPVAQLVAAVHAGDSARTRQLLADHPELKPRLDEPLPGFHFGGTALLAAVRSGSEELVDLLLASGASIDQKSHWWAGGFGVLDGDHGMHDFLISRGATVDAYSAARMGRLDLLRELAAANPDAVRHRGGDGQTPLHVASTVEVAAYLLDHGAEIDALDVDHESTPAQYQIGPHPEVARLLVNRGCRTDLMLEAALGELEAVRRRLDADPAAVHTRIDPACFPMRDPRAGGHIYQWTLGANRTAHRVAHQRGHREVFDLLMAHSPPPLRLLVACQVGDDAEIAALLRADPDLPATLSEPQRRALPDAAGEGDHEAVRRMLAAGWPLDARGDEGGTALHWASWHGDAAMVADLLRHRAPVAVTDLRYGAPPLGWAMHGSLNSWRRETGDHAAVVESLLAAGAEPPASSEDASEAVRAVLRRRG